MFGRKKIQELDILLEALTMNSSNNYKDAAKENFEDICDLMDKMKASGKYPEKTIKAYEARIEEWRPKMTNYHHQNNVKSRQ